MRNPWFTYTVRQCVEGDAFPQTSPLTEHARSCQHPARNNSDFQPQGHAESWWTIGTGTGHHYATLQKITERTQYNALQCTLIPRSRSVLDQLAFGRPTCWNSPSLSALLSCLHHFIPSLTWLLDLITDPITWRVCNLVFVCRRSMPCASNTGSIEVTNYNRNTSTHGYLYIHTHNVTHICIKHTHKHAYICTQINTHIVFLLMHT